jgi:hypothetical protein
VLLVRADAVAVSETDAVTTVGAGAELKPVS